MNVKKAKKIRKNVKHSFIVFLRSRHKYCPRWLYKLSAKIIFNKEGLEIIGFLYGLNNNTFTYNGDEYTIK